MNLRNFSKKQYRKFSEANGSEFIASEYALFKVLRLIKTFKTKTILEAGVGIGTISDSILKAGFDFELKLYGTESVEFCLQEIPGNLGKDFKKLNLFPDIQALPSSAKFDLIIIDGKEAALESLKELMSRRYILVVEGDRKDQTKILNNLFYRSKFVHSIISKKNSTYSNRPGDHFQGGLKVIFINPDFRQYLEWLKLKLASKFHFHLRKFA